MPHPGNPGNFEPPARDEIPFAEAGDDLQSLQGHSITELLAIARTEGVEVLPNLTRNELLFTILEHRLRRSGLGWAEGVLEVMPDGFGFLRSVQNDFEPRPADVFVSSTQIRHLNLKPGHLVAGPARPPRRDEGYFALLQVVRIDGSDVASLRARVPFAARTPILPHTRLRLDQAADPELRALDLLAPWAKGQRILVAMPPRLDRTSWLRRVAMTLLQKHPELHVSVCLLDQSPEDVPEFRGDMAGQRSDLVASTFDQLPGRHLAVAEMALARAHRQVESGLDVVLVIDSLTALTRACQLDLAPTGKLLCVGLDAGALHRGKRLFGAARQTAEGGSLTVIATALCGTDSRIDGVILDEFQNRGNSDVVFRRDLLDLHVHPPLDVVATRTRREDLLLPASHIVALQRWRTSLLAIDEAGRVAALRALLQEHGDNAAVLLALSAPAQ